MSVQTEIDRIITAVQAAHEKVVAKGGTTAQPYLVGNLAGAIDTIPTGSGGGSGGGSEVCTVEIVADAPVSDDWLCYLDENCEVQVISVTGMDLMMGVTLRCMRNSSIYSERGMLTDMGDSSSGGVEVMYGAHLIVVKGDGTFVIS